MQLVLTISAMIAIASLMLIAFPPLTDQDSAIKDALAYEAKQAKLDAIIKGGN